MNLALVELRSLPNARGRHGSPRDGAEGAGQAAGAVPISTSVAAGMAPDAQVAQLVEHATENRSVGGSIPPLGTTFTKRVDLWLTIARL